MPIVNGKVMTPEDAIANDACPECGRSLKIHNAIAELNSHWRTMPKPGKRGDAGIARRALLLKYIESKKISTTNQQKAA